MQRETTCSSGVSELEAEQQQLVQREKWFPWSEARARMQPERVAVAQMLRCVAVIQTAYRANDRRTEATSNQVRILSLRRRGCWVFTGN